MSLSRKTKLNVWACTALFGLVVIASNVIAEDNRSVSSALTDDHTGIVDQLILEEQESYARENAKTSTEPVQPSPNVSVPTGPEPFVQRVPEAEPYFVGVFGANKDTYRVEIYYLGSVTDYGVGDVLPGRYRLIDVNPQYVTVRREEKNHRLFLTSVSAVSGQDIKNPGISLRDNALQLPAGLMQ